MDTTETGKEMTFYRPVAYHTLKALLRVLKIGRINRINNEKSIQGDRYSTGALRYRKWLEVADTERN